MLEDEDLYRREIERAVEEIHNAGITVIPVMVFEVAGLAEGDWRKVPSSKGREVYHGSGNKDVFRGILERLHADAATAEEQAERRRSSPEVVADAAQDRLWRRPSAEAGGRESGRRPIAGARPIVAEDDGTQRRRPIMEATANAVAEDDRVRRRPSVEAAAKAAEDDRVRRRPSAATVARAAVGDRVRRRPSAAAVTNAADDRQLRSSGELLRRAPPGLAVEKVRPRGGYPQPRDSYLAADAS